MKSKVRNKPSSPQNVAGIFLSSLPRHYIFLEMITRSLISYACKISKGQAYPINASIVNQSTLTLSPVGIKFNSKLVIP